MLVELAIENLGVIERERLLFGPGFTAVTGETGAGKTMVVEAINLVVGRRADASVVRDGASEATVEARFSTAGNGDDEIVLRRVVESAGRSRAYVNGRMSTVTALAELGASLVDIHGQHAHQRLLSGTAQRGALDAFAGVDLSGVIAARRELVEIEEQIDSLGGDERTRAREIDLLRFQCSEIEATAIQSPDEDEMLAREEEVLADVVRLRESMWEMVNLLSADDGVADLLARALKLSSSTSVGDDLQARLGAAAQELVDLSAEFRGRAEGLEEDPERLEGIRTRRQVLREMMKKYGDTLEEVMNFGASARARLDELEGHSDRIAELEQRRIRLESTLEQERLVVGDQRRRYAASLGTAVQDRLSSLGLPHATLSVAVGEAPDDLAGDGVSFMFAANPGLSPQPLSKVASGGELARVMLALRLTLSEEPGTMVFDEVDAGIGGSAAVAVAKALRELGERHQVLAVTHLPQVAASAHHHITVTKQVADGATFGSASTVAGAERFAEIARMLSGGVADDSALAHARDLLGSLGGGAGDAGRN